MRLPIVAWGNGACLGRGLWFQNALTEWASHGYLVIANGSPNGFSGTTPEMLTEAVIKKKDGSTKRLIDPKTSKQDKQSVVDAISSLMTSYKSLPPAGLPKLAAGAAGAGDSGLLALASVPTDDIVSFRVGAGAATVDLGEGLKDFGDAIAVADWTNYIKKNATLYNTGKDLFGNDYGDQTVDTIPQVPAAALDVLSDVAGTGFWSPYGP